MDKRQEYLNGALTVVTEELNDLFKKEKGRVKIMIMMADLREEKEGVRLELHMSSDFPKEVIDRVLKAVTQNEHVRVHDPWTLQ